LIKPADSAAIAEAAALIQAGGLVGMPTETVYGLAADAFNAEACARIFEAKARPSFDPLIVHIGDAADLPLVADLSRLPLRGPAGAAPGASGQALVPGSAGAAAGASGQALVPGSAGAAAGASGQAFVSLLMARFWPGPLTLVLPKSGRIPSIVSSGLDTVAVRVPSHPVALALLQACGRPLAAPSANRFGQLSPTKAQHVLLGLGDAVPLILDGGPCEVGVESTIVDLSGPEARLLRPGGIPREVLEDALGQRLESGPSVLEKPLAPGQLASHYAPSTVLRRLDAPAAFDSGEAHHGLLAFKAAPEHHHYGAVEVLSPSGNLAEAAARLFDCLHRLDGQRLALIEAEPVPAMGLGLAINDRLMKAAAKAP
jgi:L-threonylcarbamoyladenylate synthase